MTISVKESISMVSRQSYIEHQRLNLAGSHLLTVDHDLHRMRRKPLEPFFSRLGVSRLEPIIIQVVEKLVARLEALKGSRAVIRLDHAFSALSGDVIGKVCCEDKEEFLDDPSFAPWWYVVAYRFCHPPSIYQTLGMNFYT